MVGLNTSNGVGGFLANPLTRDTQGKPRKEDFPEGFKIEELPDEGKGVTIALVGNQIPIVPFSYGGAQQIAKDYYPGNPQASVQVLGARENDVTIRGRLSAKRFKTQSSATPGVFSDSVGNVAGGAIDAATGAVSTPPGNLRLIPSQIADLVDDIRIRGNLVRISLGGWIRYGIIENTKWDLKDLGELNYEITFSITSFDEPDLKTPIIKGSLLLPVDLQSDLADLNASLAADAAARSIPDSVPSSISDIVNDVTGVFAGVTTSVFNFVNGIITTGEEVAGSVNRAAGVIKNAEAEVSKGYLRLARISYSLDFAGVPVADRYSASNIIGSRSGHSQDLADTLAKMRRRFEQLAATLPQARHRVKSGDTLQKLSIAAYGDDENWQKIFDHNKLASTDLGLVRGQVLEIPKLK